MDRNQPLAPADRRSAKELTENDTYYLPNERAEPGFASLRRTLVKGWKDVDILTRKPQWGNTIALFIADMNENSSLSSIPRLLFHDFNGISPSITGRKTWMKVGFGIFVEFLLLVAVALPFAA